MRRFFFGLAIGAVAAMTSSWAYAGDQEITQQVIQRLEEQKKTGQLQGFHLGVSVKDGQVWLKGYTANEQQRLAVLDAARRVNGVKAVVNELQVDPTAGQTKTASTTTSPSSNAQSNFASAPPAAPAPATAPSRAAVQPIATAAPKSNTMAAKLTSADEPAPAAAPARTAAPQRVATTVPVPATPNGHSGGRPMTRLPMPAYPTRPIGYNGQPGMGGPGMEGMSGQPIPAYNPAMGGGVAPARYDHPRMPGYAWPAYAAYPNYAAVTYPRQYSPTAFPYIGPFYPYPQVPLGWRKVTLEWDDGWWMLDFKDK